MNKIVLGTAQFGMDYGINNKRGKVSQKEVFVILNKAMENGIDTFDTAHAYKESEKVLGEFIKFHRNKLRIISKLPECVANEVRDKVRDSLDRLNLSSIYGYLIHRFEDYEKDNDIWLELEKLKRQGKIEKIGFSLYFPSQLERIIKTGLKIDIVQIPFSVFDQRFKAYFPELRKRNVEIHVRSIFLQGLVFKKPLELDNYFKSIQSRIEKLHMLSNDTGIPVFALCLNFVFKNEFIDKVVIGVDSALQLNDLIRSSVFFHESDKAFLLLSDLALNDENVILPFKWPLYREVSV